MKAPRLRVESDGGRLRAVVHFYVEAFKWPAVVLLLGVPTLWYLLPQARAFLSRVTRFRFKGAEASAEQKAVTAQEPRAVGAVHPFEVGDNPHILAVSEQIRGNVATMHFQNPDERDRWLFREGAKLTIALDFEQIYRNVWGSQMELLAAANQPAGEPMDRVEQRYVAAAQNAPNVYGNYSIGAWLGFLEQTALLHREPHR